jgi:Family of unknown function (DUF5677)
VYFEGEEGRCEVMKRLTRDEARRIAANLARLPELAIQTASMPPEVEQFRIAVRRDPHFKMWFDFADQLVRSGHEILKKHETLRDHAQHLLMSALFLRAHESLQATLTLAERGMIPDARGIVRSAVETAIASVALEAEESFIDRVIGAGSKHKLTVAREILGDVDYKAVYSAETIEMLEKTVMDIEAIDKQSPRAPVAINWKDIADKHCKALYVTLYRLF